MNTAAPEESLPEQSLRFAVLGPVRAWHGEGELDLGPPQQRVVLAALLLRRGRPVTIAELIDAVWGDEPPATAVAVLRSYVSRLRKVLEPGRDASASPRVVESAAGGYLARAPEHALDLGLFERRVAEAKRLRAAGEVSAAAELLHRALDGWEETPLAGLPGPLAEAERSRLTEERLATLELRLDIDVSLGRHGEVIAELTALTSEHPLRERLCRLFMLALYRSGRQAEALAAYRRTRSTLLDELGVEPGVPLREMHDRILAADASLDPSPRQNGAHQPVSPAVDHSALPAQLPADLPAFTGRRVELEQAQALLPDDGTHPATVVISAITGMAGTGKTALAVHWAHRVAHRYPDGQLSIDLRGFDPTGPVVPPDEAIRALLDALGVPPRRIPHRFDAQAALYRSLLADRRMLILLDNARDTEHVRPLLPGSPGCLVIVTSRNQLTGLIAGDGAHPLTLNPLTPAEAHAFLVRRVGAARPAAEPQATEEIIARCARLPLALAIVAARAATHPGFPLRAIAEELRADAGSLDAFADGDLATDLRAAFSSSCAALSVPAARLFRLVGLHSGPDICAPAAAALAGLPLRATRPLLLELTRAHLLAEHAPGRYALHDLLRVHAAECAVMEETPGERGRALERLLCWYLHTADAAHAHLAPHRRRIPLDPLPPGCRPSVFTGYDQALEWCETERRNLVAAVHRAAAARRAGIAWRLTSALWGYFHLRGHPHDWLDTARTAHDAARAAHDRTGEAWSHSDLAAALTAAGRSDEAVDHLRQAIVRHRELGDRQGGHQAVADLGPAHLRSGRPHRAVEYTRRALAVSRVRGHAWGEGIALADLGDAYRHLHRFDDAVDCLQRALVVLRAAGNSWFEGIALDRLGTVRHLLHHHDDAIRHYRRALEAHRAAGNRWGEAHTLGHLADVRLAAGEPETARDNWRQALAVFEEFGHPGAEEIRRNLHRLEERTPDPEAVPVVADPELPLTTMNTTPLTDFGHLTDVEAAAPATGSLVQGQVAGLVAGVGVRGTTCRRGTSRTARPGAQCVTCRRHP
ncbi:AfsR/SARP family transcriptional regulator [Streptomyces sp. NBC_01092]|uniref:AfsR/SARP family transcriptional regulator n=1 Tax=Streptomyces sp. NBC_01092 TaxID=2903748 RepID=UPI003869689A|nr:tetratricopeptide repeat protein [Streptomyces sp. NBC_01092]